MPIGRKRGGSSTIEWFIPMERWRISSSSLRQMAALGLLHDDRTAVGEAEDDGGHPEKSHLLVEAHNPQKGAKRPDQGVDPAEGLEQFQKSEKQP